jgi:hypothetical protein
MVESLEMYGKMWRCLENGGKGVEGICREVGRAFYMQGDKTQVYKAGVQNFTGVCIWKYGRHNQEKANEFGTKVDV